MAIFTLNDLIVSIIAKSKTPLTNSEIRREVYRQSSTSPETIDTLLSQLSKAGKITKAPVTGRGASKFEYDVSRSVARAHRSVRDLVQETVTNTKGTIDRATVLAKIQSIKTKEDPFYLTKAVDNALFTLARDGVIAKSKNPMLDTNAASQAKYVYSA